MQFQVDVMGTIAIFSILAIIGYVVYAVMKQNERLTKFNMLSENTKAFYESQEPYDIIKMANDRVPEEEKSDGKSFFDVYMDGTGTDNDEQFFGAKFNRVE